nr:N-acetylmuramidase family protein [Bacteroides sp. 224]
MFLLLPCTYHRQTTIEKSNGCLIQSKKSARRSGESKYIYCKGGLKEYDRLEQAKKINIIAAYSSASWGMFQIMGFNYAACGCKDVIEFVERMSASEGEQLTLFIRFLQANKWSQYLQSLNWSEFARRYNGPGYTQNRYDEKLAAAYQKYDANKE